MKNKKTKKKSMKKGNLPAWTRPPASNPQINGIGNSGNIFIAIIYRLYHPIC